MRKLLFSMLVGCLLLVSFQLHPSSIASSSFADQWYDTYRDLPWAEEKARLYSFAVYLRQQSEMVGYIAFCEGDKARLKAKKDRAIRAKKYLTSELKIAEERIILVDGKLCDESLTILQPMPKRAEQPKFFDIDVERVAEKGGDNNEVTCVRRSRPLRNH